jgi:hypothetical protein
MELKYVVGLVIVVAIIYLIVNAKVLTPGEGYWTADVDFCQDAKLMQFSLKIGPKTCYTRNINDGFICAQNANSVILYDKVSLKFGHSNILTIDWQDEESDSKDVFPSKLIYEYEPKYKKLMLYNPENGELCARLYYNNHLSELMDIVGKKKPDDSEPIE